MSELKGKMVNLDLTLVDLTTIRFALQPIIETYQDKFIEEISEEPDDPMTTFDIEVGKENLSVDKKDYASMNALYKKLDKIISQNIKY